MVDTGANITSIMRARWGLLLSLMVVLGGCHQANQKKLNEITVGILPGKYFVQKIVGDDFPINVMLSPGQNPATYNPLPSQMKQLASSLVYFHIGVPFEERWVKKIAQANKKMKIVDLRDGIVLREIEDRHFLDHLRPSKENSPGHHLYHDNKYHLHLGKDPHIWMSPLLVKQMAQTIYQTMVAIESKESNKKKVYRDNLDTFLQELDQVSRSLSHQLKELRQREIVVFHPAWGYFCDAFGLKQIPIEIKGTSPTPRELTHLITFIKVEGQKLFLCNLSLAPRVPK